MRRLFVTLGMLILIVPAAFAQPPWSWLQQWSAAAPAPRLGVLAADLSFQALDTLELPYGVQVTRVFPGSPAEVAGLRTDDILLELDGQPLFSVSRLHWLIGKSAPGSTLALRYLRGGESATAEIRLPEPVTRALPPPTMQRDWIWTSPSYLGVSLQSLTDGLREAFAVPGDVGMLVTEVFPASPAERAGLRPGDVIVKMHRRSVRDMDDVRRVLDYLEPGEVMEVEIIRDRQPVQLRVTLGERKVPRATERWREWHGPFGDDPPFFTDPDWWRGMEEFIQRWREYWDRQRDSEPQRAL